MQQVGGKSIIAYLLIEGLIPKQINKLFSFIFFQSNQLNVLYDDYLHQIERNILYDLRLQIYKQHSDDIFWETKNYAGSKQAIPFGISALLSLYYLLERAISG